MHKDSNVHWSHHAITRELRAARVGQRPCVLWFTGLSGAGKSTIANAAECELWARGAHSYLLDGDNVRHGLNRDLGFSDQDRVENIRRIGEVSSLFLDAGLIVLAAFISPFRADRRLVRDRLQPKEFIEIFVDAPLTVCEARDPKGLYRRARAGEISHFTGLDSPYEAPERAEVHLRTAEQSPQECARQVVQYLEAMNHFDVAEPDRMQRRGTPPGLTVA